MVPSRPKQKSQTRRGFTLLELLAVIIVIAVLASLLLPALASVRRNARIAGVVSEINQLETAIAQFKTNHGIEPPSSIVLCENASDWAANTASAALIRQIWPQYDFANHDINGNGSLVNGSANEIHTLSVGECLVFFLGGVNGNDAASASANNNLPGQIGPCTGFSKNPTSPFDRGGSREAPLFEFLPARFTDVDNDGFPEYRDALPGQRNPYLYYSSYDGQGYAEASEFGGGGLTMAYRQDANLSTTWKSNSHQIISPGFDFTYGYGGAYIPKAPETIPAAGSGSPTAAERLPERDNITNFSNGILQP